MGILGAVLFNLYWELTVWMLFVFTKFTTQLLVLSMNLWTPKKVFWHFSNGHTTQLHYQRRHFFPILQWLCLLIPNTIKYRKPSPPTKACQSSCLVIDGSWAVAHFLKRALLSNDLTQLSICDILVLHGNSFHLFPWTSSTHTFLMVVVVCMFLLFA